MNLLLSWRHSGFNVHVGNPIPADDRQTLEKLAHYIIRCPFSQERMTYHAATRKVTYRSKDGKSVNEFNALDWLASIICHIPNRWEQRVRYYGYYSNASRGKRKKLGMDDGETPVVTCWEEDTDYRKKSRANWARLIKKIYEVDPLIFPKCSGEMRIVAFIEDAPVIRRILEHLRLWDIPPRSPPASGRSPPAAAGEELPLVYSDKQVIAYEEVFYQPEYV